MWVEDVAGCGEVAFRGLPQRSVGSRGVCAWCACAGAGGSNAVAYLLRPAVSAQCVSWGVRHPVAVVSGFPSRPSRRAQLIGGRPFVVSDREVVVAQRVLPFARDECASAGSSAACANGYALLLAWCAVGRNPVHRPGDGCLCCGTIARRCNARCTGMDSLQRRSAKCAMGWGDRGCGCCWRLRWVCNAGCGVHAITSISQRPSTWVVVIVWVNCVEGSPGRISVRTSV